MAHTYLICNVHKLADQYSNSKNLVLLDDDGLELTEGEKSFSFKRNTNIDIQDGSKTIETFLCHYDEKKNTAGKVFGKEFNYFYIQKDFYAYKSNKTITFQLNSDNALNFMAHLNSTKKFKIDTVKPDFKEVFAYVSEVNGIWQKVDRPGVQSQGSFGTNVKDDPEIANLLLNHVDDISYVQFSIEYNNRTHTIGISKKGSITLANKYPTIGEELNIVFHLCELFFIKKTSN